MARSSRRARKIAFKKAGFMTDPSIAPEALDVAQTVSFLRRFADLMSNGHNVTYLQRAADLLETLTARVIAASDEEELWRYKYETLSHHADALEAECDTLKHDIEGHLDITSSVLAERDALGVTLQAREAELSGLREALSRERDERAARLAGHEEALGGLRLAFDQKREALQAALEARGAECEQLRRALERERDDGAAKLAAREKELSELRLSLERERAQLQSQLKARDDELVARRSASERENNELKAKVASLEAKRAELRSAFDRISFIKNQTVEHRDGADHSPQRKPGFDAEANPLPAQPGGQDQAVAEANVVVPKATLRQARAQFEYLAREFVPLGDIASQVMCELAAYTMDLALIANQQPGHSAADEVALSILAPSNSASLVVADNV
jgi:DNA repair exonuclease SbcCD ATPase subunit